MIKALAPLLALLVSLPTAAADLTLPIPGHDSLVFAVPADWQVRPRRGIGDAPPSVAFTAGTPASFLMMITALPSRSSKDDPTLEDMRRLAEYDAQHAKRVAAESDLPLKEFVGSNLRGYYFSATDREPQPDDFKYMTQAMLMSRELRISVTMLANGDPAKVRVQGLEMLKAARRAPAEKGQ